MTIAPAALPLALVLAAAAPAPAAQLEVSIERLRSARGQVHVCLTRDSAHFPNCAGDPAALKRSVSAGTASVRFDGVQPGAYAVSLFHDENANGKFDTFAGIPREGFGFSRNPAVRFGAPRFRQVVIDLPSGFARQAVRMQYLL
ncbi:MAG TPA: DUF2141 domain-containing protein [Allosphingosinicella sp.]|jgi:uncharacterized protein (DUF2141 family)|nr:DUF2141 domain-containing protein [Allosphingosinicella sp.]